MINSPFRYVSATFAVCAPLVAFPALSEEPQNNNHVSIGVSAINTPRYSGSDETTTIFAPVIDVREAFLFVNFEKGLGYEIELPAGFYFQNAVGYSAGRKDKDKDMQFGSDKLRGMSEIKGTMNTSLALGWNINDRISTEISVWLPLGESYGARYTGSVTGVLLKGDSNIVTLRLAALFGDRRYNQTYYGVDARQSQGSGYAKYAPGGGMYGQSVALSWIHIFSEHWSATLGGNYTHLNDKVAESPIVFKKDGLDGFAAVSYTF
ncbi:TPA: MipA/OmpV family protein [Yersinia enterocolitica]|nr:MipA/OmpV family protein [Yersinia enterocolitica]